MAVLKDASIFDFQIVRADDSAGLIECESRTANLLVKQLGGCYKLCRVLPDLGKESLQEIKLPGDAKFNWTISAYSSDAEDIENSKDAFHAFLKSEGFGKAKFLEPTVQTVSKLREKQRVLALEMRANELDSRIMSPSGKKGIDFVLHGGISGSPAIFGYTIATSDLSGFEKRDFNRPYQDPTMTLSPRLARILVNLAAMRNKIVLLDPFCGLGTILQEALLCGHRVIGSDKSRGHVEKTKANLNWLSRAYRIDTNSFRVFQSDARELDVSRHPKVDSIASEPILLPVFRDNPEPRDASVALSKSYQLYMESLQNLVQLLRGSGSRVAIMTPTVFDSMGNSHTINLDQITEGLGLRAYHPKSAKVRIEYPLKIEPSTKKKIVQRSVNLLYLP